jgi:thioredoxin 1
MKRYAILLIVLIVLFGCKGKSDQSSSVDQDSLSTEYSVSDVSSDSTQLIKGEQPIDKASAVQKTKQTEKEATPKTEPVIQEESQTQGYKVTFMEIGSKTCIPCKMMQPIMKEIAEEYKGIVKVEFYDLMEDREIGPRYSIRVMPTQVFLDANGREFFRHEGFYPKDELAKMLNGHLAKSPK